MTLASRISSSARILRTRSIWLLLPSALQMMRLIEDAPLRVFVAGAGVRGGGYPNAWNTVRVLRSMPGVDVVDLCNWLPDSFRLWTIGRTGRLNALVVLLRLLLANAISAIRLLARVRGSDRVYV